MNNPFFKNAAGSAAILLALIAVFVPYSLFLGWNLMTMLLFWFVILPLVAIRLPYWTKLPGHPIVVSASGVILFYSLAVFMIYKQYKTDYFVVMSVSMFFTLLVFAIVGLIRYSSVKRTSRSES